MAKNKSSYVCQNCGAHFGKWAGQCTDCGEWNSLVEAPNVSMPHHNKSTAKPNTVEPLLVVLARQLATTRVLIVPSCRLTQSA